MFGETLYIGTDLWWFGGAFGPEKHELCVGGGSKITYLIGVGLGFKFSRFGKVFRRYLQALEAHGGYLEGPLAPLVEGRIWGRILGYILGGPGSLGEWPEGGKAGVLGSTKNTRQ